MAGEAKKLGALNRPFGCGSRGDELTQLKRPGQKPGPFKNMGSVADIGEQSKMSGTFDGDGELTLMLSAGTGNAAGNDFRSLRQASSQFRDIFVVADVLDFIGTESANLFTAFSAVSASFRSIKSHEYKPPCQLVK